MAPKKLNANSGVSSSSRKNAFLDPHAELAQGVSEAVYTLPKLTIADAGLSRLDGNFFSPAFLNMAIDKVGSGVELVGKQNGRARNHLTRLIWKWRSCGNCAE